MRQTRHLGAEIELIDRFFKRANRQHLPVEMEPTLVASASWRLRFGFLGLSHQVSPRKIGVLEWWSTGVLGFPEPSTPPLHHSSTPLLQSLITSFPPFWLAL